MLKKEWLLSLQRGTPINYEGLMIYPLSFKTIYDEIGDEVLNQLLLPFRLTEECYDGEEIGKINIFLDKVLKDESLICLLVECLKKFCLEEDFAQYGVTEDTFAIVRSKDDIFHITETGYKEIGEIILAIANVEKIKIEKPDPNLSERQLDVWKKITEGRKKDEEKNALTMADLLNICEFGSEYHVPIETLETWSPWKIKRCFNNITSKNNYNDSVTMFHPLANNIDSFTGSKHWIEQFKVRK